MNLPELYEAEYIAYETKITINAITARDLLSDLIRVFPTHSPPMLSTKFSDDERIVYEMDAMNKLYPKAKVKAFKIYRQQNPLSRTERRVELTLGLIRHENRP